jgi:hypothetical protein
MAAQPMLNKWHGRIVWFSAQAGAMIRCDSPNKKPDFLNLLQLKSSLILQITKGILHLFSPTISPRNPKGNIRMKCCYLNQPPYSKIGSWPEPVKLQGFMHALLKAYTSLQK